MTSTPEAVFEALRENNKRPYGRQRTLCAEELVGAAERLDDKGALVTALFELMSAYTYAGEERKSPVVFARIVRMWDEGPEDFSEWEEHQLHRRYTWVAHALIQVPEVPLAAIEGWTREMRARYEKAGHGTQPVYATRHLIARHTGVDTRTAYEQWTARPRTALSDCEACETRMRALHSVAAGDDEAALAQWAPVLGGGRVCLEEPCTSMAHALLPLLRTGRADEARSRHLAGYRFARGHPDMAEAVGLHVEFCALTHNEARGLEILAENRGGFDLPGAPLDRLGFLTGAQVLLSRLDAGGHGELTAPGPPGRSWTVAELLAHVRAEGSALAAAFDARNGTDAVGRRRRERLAAAPLLDHPLPLGVRAARLASAAPVPCRPAGAEPEPEPTDFAALVALARRWTAVGRPDADRLWDRVRKQADADGHEHDPSLGPRALLRAELAEHDGFGAFDHDRWRQGRESMLAAAALYEEAGSPGRASAARARAATALLAGCEVRPEERLVARAELEAELRTAEAAAAAAAAAAAGTGDAPTIGREQAYAAPDMAADAAKGEADGAGSFVVDSYLTVLQCAATAARQDLVDALPDPPQEAADAFEASVARLHERAEWLGSPARAAAARQYAADVAARTGRYEAATADLEEALSLIEEAGQPWRTPRPLALLAQVKVRVGRAEEAVPLARQALSAAARWPDRSLSLGSLHALLGHASAHRGDSAGAVRHLSEAAERLDREGGDEHAAQVRLELAEVLGGQGRTADSVAVLESMVLAGAAEADPRTAGRVRLTLARGLASLGELRAAAEEFVRLADEVATWPEQRTHTLVASEAAVALARAGQPDAARTAYARAVESHARAPRAAPVLTMMREFARLGTAEEAAGGLPEALRHLERAEEVIAAASGREPGFACWYESGAVHYQRARCHADAGRYREGLEAAERAVAAYEGGGAEGERPRAEAVRVAALLEARGLGEEDAARVRLAEAIARCEAAGLAEAAAALAAVRDGLAAG